MVDLLQRPELTMPEAEAALLAAAYGRAGSILEYGSGGSTAMAAEMPGKRVTSVESDADWAAMMRAWFAANPPARGSTVEVVWADIGPTKEWGYPKHNGAYARYPDYPLAVWQRQEPVAPDVVLDGRFRVGCALATALMTKKPLDLYFDDYHERRNYHVVEHWLGAPELTGRMAHFRVAPLPLDLRELGRIMKLMLRQA